MKLWVDDIRSAPDETWHVARTITAAAHALYHFTTEITEISLDHDISHQVTVGDLSRPFPCPENFQPVAQMIGLLKNQGIYMANAFNWKPKVTIHTSNPVGAKQIASILDEYDVEYVIKLTGAANRLEMEL